MKNSALILMGISQKKYERVIRLVFGHPPAKTHDFLSDTDSTLSHQARKKHNAAYPPHAPLFSVVIPTYNGGHRIAHTMDSIRKQTADPATYEIIVVNDGSDDVTEDHLAHYFMDHPAPTPMTLITLPQNTGPATARNIGILSARGSYVAFTDDDCIVPEQWIERMHNAFLSHPHISGAGGWIRIRDKTATIYDHAVIWPRVPFAEHSIVSTTLHPFNLCGDTANVCYKKSALTTIGGFNRYFRFPTTEDWELKIRMHKAGHALYYMADSAVLHDKRLTFTGFLRFWVRHGWGCFLLAALHPETGVHFDITAATALKRVRTDIRRIFTPSEPFFRSRHMPLAQKTAFAVLVIVKNFCLWSGKYWIPIFELPI